MLFNPPSLIYVSTLSVSKNAAVHLSGDFGSDGLSVFSSCQQNGRYLEQYLEQRPTLNRGANSEQLATAQGSKANGTGQQDLLDSLLFPGSSNFEVFFPVEIGILLNSSSFLGQSFAGHHFINITFADQFPHVLSLGSLLFDLSQHNGHTASV
jgi:hypothetical protein